MTEANKILRMIEAVDPEDTDVLKEIDARVWCYLNDVTFVKPITRADGKVIAYRTKELGDISVWVTPRNPGGKEWVCDRLRYSQNRGVLKIIRPKPDGQWWSYEIKIHNDASKPDESFAQVYLARSRDFGRSYTPALPTEELAELHAIIQAWKFEKGEGRIDRR